MSIARWVIPLVVMGFSGCASMPDAALQDIAHKGSDKPVIAEKTAKSDSVKQKKTAAAKPGATKADLVKGGKSKKAVHERDAKLGPESSDEKPEPIVTASLPPSVFIDANSLVTTAPAPRRPSPQAQTGNVTNRAATTLGDPSALSGQSVRRALPQSLLVPPPVLQKPMKFLTKLQQTGAAPDGTFGYILLDAQTGQVLSEGNADNPMPPASIAKMLATIAILETKGMDGRFRTSLLADGSLSGGILNGDLHIVGTGDPSLDRNDLSGMARRLAAAGVRKVNGGFFYHGDNLPEVSVIDPNQSVGAVYNPGISGLNLDRNEHRGASPVKNPAKYAADAMRRLAAGAGVILPAPRKGRGGPKGTEIVAHDSDSVEVILTEMFDISRNMTAEVLGAAAAGQLSRKPNSLREAAQINVSWAKSAIGPIGGAEWRGIDLENNSGLSRRSYITPRQMAAMTRYGYQRYGQRFKNIHEAQTTGSNGGVDYRIATKIGTLSYVRGLTGFITLGGRDMVFAIMANDPRRRMRNARGWMSKARRLEQALMSDWLQNNWPTTQTVSQ